MSDIQNIANTPIDFTLSGKVYKVRRLSLLDYFAEFQTLIKQDHLNDTIKLAEKIKDSNERIDFQVKSMKNIPQGEELENSAWERISTIEGGTKILEIVLKKDNVINDAEFKELLSDNKNITTIKTIILFARGLDVENENKEVKEDKKK